MSFTSFMVRHSFKKGDDKRDAGLTTPESIKRYDDIVYGPHEMNVLDVYSPWIAPGKTLPVIVSVHGGGWVYGDKERYQYYCMDLAKRGFVVVNFTYRLSPEYKFPCHLEDTVKVFEWVLTNGSRYGMDTDNIFAVGDSAGAHILSLFCAMCTNRDYAAKYDFKTPEGFFPKAIALNCGVYDMELAKAGPASDTMKLMKDVLPKKGTPQEYHMVSPIHHVNRNFPPCYIMTSNGDFLKDQPEPFINKLKELGVLFQYKLYGDEEHVQYHVFHLDMRNEVGKQCNDEQCEYFKSFLPGWME